MSGSRNTRVPLYGDMWHDLTHSLMHARALSGTSGGYYAIVLVLLLLD